MPMQMTAENIVINQKLSDLYQNKSVDFLREWQLAFQEDAPCRINEFGIIDPERFDTKRRILFIAKETNDWKDEEYKNNILFRSWMQDISQNGLRPQTHIKQHPNMWYNIGRWAILIVNPDISLETIASFKKEAISTLGTIAFTNINKVRGKATSGESYHRLAYTPIVGEILQREIELISPQTIVCCGTYRCFSHHVKNFRGKVIIMPHPGARKSKRAMLEHLKEQLQTEYPIHANHKSKI